VRRYFLFCSLLLFSLPLIYLLNSFLVSALQEVNKLRNAHSKALETVMGYQEENDVLRSAVMELSSKSNSIQNSRQNSAIINNINHNNNNVSDHSPPPAPPINRSSSDSPVPPLPQSEATSPVPVSQPVKESPKNSSNNNTSNRMTASNLISNLLNNPPSALGTKRNPIRSTTNMI
jgi:hypothetical protein